MNTWKKRFAAFLCLVMTLGLLWGSVPQMTVEVQAAGVQMILSYPIGDGYSSAPGSFTIEAGQKNYIGDSITVLSDVESTKLSLLAGVQYTSSKTSIASINKKTGLITTKKPGVTTITAAYGGRKVTCRMTVVKAGSLGTTSAWVKKIMSYIDKYTKGFNGKITASNCYTVYNKGAKLLQQYEKIVGRDYWNGFAPAANGRSSKKMVITNTGRWDTLMNTIYKYVDNTSPIGPNSSKIFQISSISGKKGKNTISVKLKNKVTKNQIFGIQAQSARFVSGKTIKEQKNAVFTLYVDDITKNKRYKATATAKLDSNVLNIKLPGSTKLTAGHTYRLLDESAGLYGWTQGRTFSV